MTFRLKHSRPVSQALIAHALAMMEDVQPERVLWSNSSKGREVREFAWEGRVLVAKIYTHRSVWHRIAARLGSSQADRYYDAALTLQQAGVAVPEPVLLVHVSRAGLPFAAVLVMTRVEGAEIRHALPSIEGNAARVERLASRVAAVVNGLKTARIVHRDLNAKNLLVTEDDRVTLIDLDAAKGHRWNSLIFRAKHARDVAKLLKGCRAAPGFVAALKRELGRRQTADRPARS